MILFHSNLIAQIEKTENDSTTHIQQAESKRLERNNEESIDGIYIPKDIDNCLTELDKLLKKKERQKFMTSLPVDYHFSQGLYVRNNWGLWQGSRLQQYFYNLGIKHPDDMSSIILNCYWRYLRGEPINFEKEVERHSPIPTPQLMIPDN